MEYVYEPCLAGLNAKSLVVSLPSFISPLILILKYGSFFYLLRSLHWTVPAYFDKGGRTDSEHMETNTESCKCLSLHDLDRNDSESDFLQHYLSISLWGYPAEVSLARMLSISAAGQTL